MKRLVLLLLVGAAVAGCGRKGPLEPPPAAAAKTDTAQKPPATADRPFVLDPLI